MKQFRKNSRKALAAGMSVWLSGVVFLFFCYMPMAASASEYCPLAKSSAAAGHCNKSRNTKNSQLASHSSSQALDCCGFMPAVFDKTRKVEREIHTAQPSSKPAISQGRFAPAPQRDPQTTRFYASISILQKKIFIKHGAFRI
jgi:hypothetical protein